MTKPSLNDLAEALVGAAPVLDERGRRIAGTVYRALGRGIPVWDDAVAIEAQVPIDDVRSALASWPGVFRDADSGIIGFWGLALPEMPHTLDVNGVRLHAWCAWDTLFLPGVLAADAHVQSVDPQSEETVRLTVTPNSVSERSHERIGVSFLTPDESFEADVITTFCHYVHFFTDADSAAPWLVAHDRTFLIGLDDAFELGRRWNIARGL